MINIGHYYYQDELDLISNFKKLLKPNYNGPEFSLEDIDEYNLLIEWLKKHNFIIIEFPNVINHQIPLVEFGYNQIREFIQKRDNNFGAVSWASRRELIDSLTIINKNNHYYFADNQINEILKNMTGIENYLYAMTYDEQLSFFNNAIEYLLKKSNGYVSIDSSIFYDFLGNESIIKFRKDTQVFRHYSESSIKEREQWDDEKKRYYCMLGLLILNQVKEIYFN